MMNMCRLKHTEAELLSMTLAEEPVARDLNRKNKRPRLAIKDFFNEQMRKHAHADYFVNHTVF